MLTRAQSRKVTYNPVTDPNYGTINPLLLLHFDGVNGSTVLTDSSVYKRLLLTSMFSLYTAQHKYGVSCGGAGAFGYVEVTDSSGLVLDGVFSIDFDYQQVEVGANIALFGKGGFFKLQRYENLFYLYDDAGAFIFSGLGNPLVGGWNHIQLRRNSSNLLEFVINNVVRWSGVVVGRICTAANTNKFRVGFTGIDTMYASGYYDEFRIIKEYVAPKVLPSSPYPDHY